MVDNNPNSSNGYSTTWAQNVSYDFAGRLSSWQRHTGVGYDFDTSVAETLGYNVNGQLTSMSWSYQDPVYDRWGAAAGIQYVYSASQNNGQITQAVETWSGQNISYQYDALKRLISAASTPTGSGAPAAWTEAMQYDGFGNLTAKVLNGATTPIPVNAATNRLQNASYDANGNMISGAGATLGYDEANRIVSAAEYSGGTEYYAYAPDGKRMFRQEADGMTQEWTFWGARGEKLGTFAMVYNQYVGNSAHPYQPVLNPTLSFAGRTIWDGGKPLVQDRIGTNRATGARYYPFGDEITSTANDAVKFGTYHRDGFTGLDYADQRYYASTYGRFNTADPYRGSAKLKIASSWNRYAYVLGDPVNHTDKRGLDQDLGDSGGCWWDEENEVLNCSATGTADSDDDSGGDDDSVSSVPDPDPAPPTKKPKPPVKKKASNPQCDDAKNNRSRFFQQLPGLLGVAKQLDVPANFIVGLASYESGWLDDHNAALNNLWGLTNAGGPNQGFSSVQAGNSYFVQLISPFIQGDQTLSDFFAGLKAEGYNSANPDYFNLDPTKGPLANRISNIQKWATICGVSF
jgi:RHS repeat-associated protein